VSTATHTLFVYGTLQYPALIAAVLGRRPPTEAATLDGYARFAVRGEPFPGIVPWPGARVDGRLYSGLRGCTRSAIDDFEGPLYGREQVSVLPRSGAGPVSAETFVVHARWRHLLAAHDWDPAAFERDWYHAYLRELQDGPDADAGP
jgi:gamma-glutamylcyclotransferase (GGCT)/AIG2-like uncharacterized protein YtfP